MENTVFGHDSPVYEGCRNSSGKEECRTYLHRWISSGKSPTCSAFANIPVKLVACGEGHVIFVSNSCRVFSLGENDFGQLGLGDRVERRTPGEISFFSEKRVGRISSGHRHSCAISEEGEVFSWGSSLYGQCGQDVKDIFTSPCKVEFLDRSCEPSMVLLNLSSVKVREIACGELHTLAIDSQGALWSWGSGLATGLGQGDEEILAPMKVKKMGKKRVVQIACGKLHSIALVQESDVDQKSGKFIQEVTDKPMSVDSTVDGRHVRKVPVELSDVESVGQSETEFHYSPKNVYMQRSEPMPAADGISEFEKIGSVGLSGICQVWVWGDNSCGQLGIGNSAFIIENG